MLHADAGPPRPLVAKWEAGRRLGISGPRRADLDLRRDQARRPISGRFSLHAGMEGRRGRRAACHGIPASARK